MDLLPLEFAKLDRPLASGPAPSDSDGAEFYEELRQAERARADEIPSTEEDPWEPADRPTDRPDDRPEDRTEPPKAEKRPEETTRDFSPDGRSVEGDETSPDSNAAEAKDTAQQPPVGLAALIQAPASPTPAATADAPATTGPQRVGPVSPEVAAEVPPLKATGHAKTTLRPTAEAAPQVASAPTNSTVGDTLQAVRGADRPLSAPSQSLPTAGAAPINTPVAAAQAPETAAGQIGAEPGIRNPSDLKTKSADTAGVKRAKIGQAGPAALAGRIAPQANATELKSALMSGAKPGAGANQAGPAEWTGGSAFAAFASAANFANPAGSPGPASSVFGIALPNALPQAGGTADGFSIDGQSVARRGAAVEQVAVRLQLAVKQGQDHINIRLHPAELGRVEVKLDLAEDAPLRAILIAERSDTLELLQRDAGQLERTLSQAGLKLDSGSLSFGLQDQAHDGNGDKQSTGAGSAATGAGDEDLPAPQGPWSNHDGVLDLVI